MDARNGKRTGLPVVFEMADGECIWSKAGFIESRECINAFDCPGCSLERSVRTAIEEKRGVCGQPGRRNAMLSMPNGQCRHVLSGRISYGVCSHASCATCPVEQMVEDSGLFPSRRRTDVCDAVGFTVARKYYYHRGHAWARIEYGGQVRVGIDDFALRLLGPQDVIEPPALGSTLNQGGPAIVLRRSGREIALPSPVDGVVVAVNRRILQRASAANDAPYEDGWLMVIQPTKLQENLENLFFDAEGLSWISDEAIYLNSMLAEESRLSLVAAGSAALRDVSEEAPEIGWDRLVSEFMA